MEQVRHLWNNPFLRHNLIFFAGAVAVGALNYLYYPVLGRLLNPEAFGEVQVLVSFFLQLAIFLNVFSMITINIVANYKDSEKAQRAVYELEKLALLISIVVLLVVITCSDVLRQTFQFESGWPFIILAISLVVSVPFTFRTAFLRATKKFGQTSFANLISAGGKLIFSVLFVLLGLSTLGAIGGLVAAQIVALGYAIAMARRAGLVKYKYYFRKLHVPSVVPELKYALLVFIGSSVITLLFSVDSLVVKYLFDPETAGHYGGISTVARIVFFLTASIAQVLLPSITLTQTSKQNRSVLYKSLALTTGVSLPILLVSLCFPNQLIVLLMGQTYLPFAHLLPPLTLAIFIISIANLLVLYHVALRRWGVAIGVILGAVVTLGLMFVNNKHPEDIVNNLLIGSMTLTLVLSAWMLTLLPKRNRKAQ